MEMPELSGTTRHALQEAVLSPRFYTTDFAAIDRLNIDALRDEFEWIRDEFAHDYNKGHFVRNEEFNANFDDMPVRSQFIEFLERSCTAEFSGCLLYAEMTKHLKDPTLRAIFKYMSRDEGRHAGFLNKTMADLNVELDLGVLHTRKKYTYFKPKFIFYATYLSEKIGYARYITIYRQLQKQPNGIIHPIFKWFEEWCQDEYRHGEFFSLLMRSQPELLSRANRRWIRFFLLAVYATMYINDARRNDFYAALGLNWREYDQDVIRLTNHISTQVYPVTLPVDNPQFFHNLDACVEYDRKIRALEKRKDPIAIAQSARLRAAIGTRLLSTYRLQPAVTNEATRWKGLDGFPNYPGPGRERATAA
ncbi:MAG: magnesium-protoporphyrin IX monomethyl ester (oxidative) cyclase [Chloroflexi bacterium AL-W]|nr:magnesium-protoporphyrin IX monomethyl ester (oxidative) cyclase [Chloroflexi bacterium AL-N1]NOK65156.1 magnesium-protoporphyrin IX monomethyl ester (oxidative) cyclase [Chloroflexi bacterium AL-N10]NOK72578.1 magnesium-protoporphyrin IX monomethyl ester (oxidative) cyclase [Chloroflexi bacterium AL-N5]NOK79335.1 magnesium-protoporphyrin IX monomethyl ester (oxidative) cyclase [Chloroflexi bacterium AL-W]NOK87251.1 magnesium-protoporphyrin IX monomethyl ester (oxidative) cyclase [Chloroflex